MHRFLRLTLPCAVLLAVSCKSSGTTKAPAPSPAPSPQPSTTPATTTPTTPAGAQPGRGGAPGGGPPPAGGRPTLTPEQRAARRDSISQVRTATVQQLMGKIAGRENDPAGQVFKNVQIMKDVQAGQFLQAMDQNFGRALSMGCTSCHVVDQWDSDERTAKKTARLMVQIVNVINSEQLTKMPPNRNGQTPRVSCVTCHRGNGNPGTALVP